MNEQTKTTDTAPPKQIGFVCNSLPAHFEDSILAGNHLVAKGHGFEIYDKPFPQSEFIAPPATPLIA